MIPVSGLRTENEGNVISCSGEIDLSLVFDSRASKGFFGRQ